MTSVSVEMRTRYTSTKEVYSVTSTPCLGLYHNAVVIQPVLYEAKFVVSKKLKYRVIKNDCRGFNNLSHTIHLR